MNQVINSLMQKRKPPKSSICPKHNTKLQPRKAKNYMSSGVKTGSRQRNKIRTGRKANKVCWACEKEDEETEKAKK